MWILAPKLPNSDLNFAVDFWVNFSLLFYSRKKLSVPKTLRLKTQKRCDFYSAAQKNASDFSAISSAIFWRFFCDFCGKTCDLALCDLKTQRFFCDCDFWDAKGKRPEKTHHGLWDLCVQAPKRNTERPARIRRDKG